MQISNNGRGVHRREIVGVEKLRELPASWYAFTNLEVATGPTKAREIDVVLIAEDRIFVIDLKDWNGRIESENGRWLQNGVDCGASPVQKIAHNSREIGYLLQSDLKKRHRSTSPYVQGLVLITGKADWSMLAPTEKGVVFHIDDFVRSVTDLRTRIQKFGAVGTFPLTDPEWKARISNFFNARNGPVRPGKRRYGSFVGESEHPTFEHPNKIYAEFAAADEASHVSLGTIRLWDFSNADARFQNEEGRQEIAGREKAVYGYLQDADDEIETSLLSMKFDDPEKGVNYWEVYDRRKRMERLSDFVPAQADRLRPEIKIELAKQLISKVAALHRVNAAHLDLGGHSIWLEAPTSVRLSHLMAAHFPTVQTLGDTRFQFLSSVHLPETVYEVGSADPMRRDVYLLGVCVHFLLFGTFPHEDGDHLHVWNSEVDAEGTYARLHAFFERALSLTQTHRFKDADEVLTAFTEATASAPDQKYLREGLESFRSVYRSQRQFSRAYPDDEPILESDRVDTWISDSGGSKKVVKLWKKAAWGDQERESPRILSFLNAARDAQISAWPNCARVLDVCWLNDAIGLVQEYVDGSTLSAMLSENGAELGDSSARLTFLMNLIDIVSELHQRGSAHGDLKPDNIVLGAKNVARP